MTSNDFSWFIKNIGSHFRFPQIVSTETILFRFLKTWKSHTISTLSFLLSNENFSRVETIHGNTVYHKLATLTVLFGGVSETACLLVIYKARKCEFICSIVEAEIKPDGRSVYKVNHFGAPGVKFWWRNSHVCRDHFPQSRSMPNYNFFHPRALRHVHTFRNY